VEKQVTCKTSVIKSDLAGNFRGYANVFDFIDNQGDSIKPGAFQDTLNDYKKKGLYPNMYFDHNPCNPIGKWSLMKEDSYGLYVEGKLLFDLPMARKVHAIMHSNSLGLSVGIEVVKSETMNGIRYIHQVRLQEISLTKDPANQKARIFNR
jgi:HK97 family phage prohead protease